MPIGTSNTALTFNVAKLPITRLPAQQKQKSIWWEILAFIGVQVIAAVLAPLTGGISESVGIALGLSDFGIALLSGGTEFLVDFGINQLYDVATKTASVNNTILNILPGLGAIGKITRGYRTTKILKLAKETKILEKLGITNAKNLEHVLQQLTGKKIISDEFKTIFDYSTIHPTKETVLNNLGFIAQRKFYKDFSSLDRLTTKQLLDIRYNLKKIHVSLVQKIKPIDAERANNLLKQVNVTLDDVAKMPVEEWFKVVSELQEKGIGKNLILYINEMRSSKIYNAKLLNVLSQTSKKLGNIARRLNPEFWVKKAIERTLEPIKEYLAKIEEKIRTKIKQFEDKVKKVFTKSEQKALEKGAIIPLNSKPFLGYKVRPLGIAGDVALTIFYREHIGKTQVYNYEPITVITTPRKVEEFTLASSPFRYYINKSGWAFGWGLRKNKLLAIINFAPPEFQKVVKDAYRTYRSITKIFRVYSKLKTYVTNTEEKIESLQEKITDFTIEGFFGTSLIAKGLKSFTSKGKKSVRKLLKKGSKRLTNKISRKNRGKIYKEW